MKYEYRVTEGLDLSKGYLCTGPASCYAPSAPQDTDGDHPWELLHTTAYGGRLHFTWRRVVP
jgi:hypothetical protein